MGGAGGMPTAPADGDVCPTVDWTSAGLDGWNPFAWRTKAPRHSFISYRLGEIQSVPGVALEGGNSPRMVFSNYRELVRAAAPEAFGARLRAWKRSKLLGKRAERKRSCRSGSRRRRERGDSYVGAWASQARSQPWLR